MRFVDPVVGVFDGLSALGVVGRGTQDPGAQNERDIGDLTGGDGNGVADQGVTDFCRDVVLAGRDRELGCAAAIGHLFALTVSILRRREDPKIGVLYGLAAFGPMRFRDDDPGIEHDVDLMYLAGPDLDVDAGLRVAALGGDVMRTGRHSEHGPASAIGHLSALAFCVLLCLINPEIGIVHGIDAVRQIGDRAHEPRVEHDGYDVLLAFDDLGLDADQCFAVLGRDVVAAGRNLELRLAAAIGDLLALAFGILFGRVDSEISVVEALAALRQIGARQYHGRAGRRFRFGLRLGIRLYHLRFGLRLLHRLNHLSEGFR